MVMRFIHLISKISRLALGLPQPYVQSVPKVVSLVVMHLGHEANH
jgi:hypothetical protein